MSFSYENEQKYQFENAIHEKQFVMEQRQINFVGVIQCQRRYTRNEYQNGIDNRQNRMISVIIFHFLRQAP